MLHLPPPQVAVVYGEPHVLVAVLLPLHVDLRVDGDGDLLSLEVPQEGPDRGLLPVQVDPDTGVPHVLNVSPKPPLDGKPVDEGPEAYALHEAMDGDDSPPLQGDQPAL